MHYLLFFQQFPPVYLSVGEHDVIKELDEQNITAGVEICYK